MDLDGLEPRRKEPEQPDLSNWSVGEIEAYIADLEREIVRARQVMQAKSSHRSGAEALFRKPG